MFNMFFLFILFYVNRRVVIYDCLEALEVALLAKLEQSVVLHCGFGMSCSCSFSCFSFVFSFLFKKSFHILK